MTNYEEIYKSEGVNMIHELEETIEFMNRELVEYKRTHDINNLKLMRNELTERTQQLNSLIDLAYQTVIKNLEMN
jgi:hypothetical protein